MHIWWGPELVHIYNDPQISVLGSRHPAVFGQPARAVWPEIWSVLQPQIDAVMLQGQSTWNDKVHVMLERNGAPEDAWFTWSYSPIRNDAGEVQGLFSVGIEETPRVKTEHDTIQLLDEQREREAAERARSILLSITDGFFALDREWRFTFVNPQGEKILDRTPGDLLGKSIWEVYPGVVGTEFERAYRRCATERAAVAFVAYFSDHQRWYEVRSYPSSEGISVYFQDVSARIEVERTLADTRQRLDSALAAGKISTWILDLVSNRIFSDNNATEFFNLPPDHGLGHPLASYADLIHLDDKSRVLSLIAHTIATGEDYEAVYRIVSFDPPHWTFARARVERDPTGKVVRLAGVAINISERKRAEEERDKLLESERVARAEAERAGRMKDEFLATLSHELRTPLNAVLGWCDVLKTGPKDAADLAEGLDIIERNGRAQAQIIEDMLDMSRIMSGKIRLDVQRTDVALLLREALETVKPAADSRGIRLVQVLDTSTTMVSGDPNRLQQVFWNLLSNAVKFTPKGGRVQVVMERVNSHLEISVVDTGEGIKPEFLPYVFDRFRQADSSTTRRHGGLGLGLSIVKSLVELHGGSVSAQSLGAGTGSTFIVKLPLLPIHAGPEADRERRHPQVGNPPLVEMVVRERIQGVKILVVDDEADARNLLKRLLADCGAKIITAGSADDAYAAVISERPDVLISDIGMPGEDGYSLMRRVRALPPEKGGLTPAVALTAYARSEDRTRSILAGYQMHIPKPVEPAELITVVASLAGRMGRG